MSSANGMPKRSASNTFFSVESSSSKNSENSISWLLVSEMAR